MHVRRRAGGGDRAAARGWGHRVSRLRAPAGRVFRLLAALLQLGLPGAAAWADARLDAAGTHATAHFESRTTNSCARIHPPEWALCHFLTAPVLTGRATPLRLKVAERRTPRPVHPSVSHPPLPRPPP